MIDYVELLIGEALLGNPYNTYLYVCNDEKAEREALDRFIVRVGEEEQRMNVLHRARGYVMINNTQRFYFTHLALIENASRGFRFDRVFINVDNDTDRHYIKDRLFPCVATSGGDFV